LPQSLGGLGDLIKSEAEDNGISSSEQRAIENFIYKCINNNENEFIPPQVEEGATLSINKEWFVCNNTTIDCIIEPSEEGEQISFEGPTSDNYTQCTSDGQCPFVNDAGFNIKIKGNSPTPNTIPAQVYTKQQVESGAGLFSVTEDLFSNRFVPNAIFDVENVFVGDIIFTFPPSPPLIIAFDQTDQRVFTAVQGASNLVSIIDLDDPNPGAAVTNIPLGPSGGNRPVAIAFDQANQRVFTANDGSNSVSIINFPTVAKICQDSGFDTGDIRTFVSGQQTSEQITCVNFVGQCTGNINDGETRECTVEDYLVSLDEVPTNGDGIGILTNTNNSQHQLFTTDITSNENKTKTQSLPTAHSINTIPIH
jgi:hypothetical protein